MPKFISVTHDGIKYKSLSDAFPEDLAHEYNDYMNEVS
jgi:hypothetical protein